MLSSCFVINPPIPFCKKETCFHKAYAFFSFQIVIFSLLFTSFEQEDSEMALSNAHTHIQLCLIAYAAAVYLSFLLMVSSSCALQFDASIQSRWRLAMERGYFRYNLTTPTIREIPGAMNLVALVCNWSFFLLLGLRLTK